MQFEPTVLKLSPAQKKWTSLATAADLVVWRSPKNNFGEFSIFHHCSLFLPYFISPIFMKILGWGGGGGMFRFDSIRVSILNSQFSIQFNSIQFNFVQNRMGFAHTYIYIYIYVYIYIYIYIYI